jgi:hypothetical protein
MFLISLLLLSLNLRAIKHPIIYGIRKQLTLILLTLCLSLGPASKDL